MSEKLRDREPVRVYVYGVAAAIVMALVAFGLVSGDQAVAVIGVAAAVVAVPAAESARARVVPVAKLADGEAVTFREP